MSEHLRHRGRQGVHHLVILCAVVGVAAMAGCSTATPSTTQPVVKQLTVNGTRLFYQEQGSGEPVVFVHGAVSDYRIWADSREPVAAKHRFIALTQRYFGTNPWPDSGEKFSASTHADDLATFVRQLGVGPVHLVGWSYGGAVQFLMASRNPELVKSIFSYEPNLATVLTEPADIATFKQDVGAAMGPVVAHSKAGDQAAAAKALANGVNAEPDAFDRLRPWVQSIILGNARVMPLMLAAPPPPVTCAQLAGIKVPVTVAYGDQTRPWFRVHAEAVSRCVQGTRRAVLPGSRHLLPILNPARFNDALLAHLQQQ